MGVAYHTVYTPDGAAVNLFDRVTLGLISVTYPAGTTTGVAATIPVTFGEPIATPYWAQESKIESSTSIITGRTSMGFTLTITPGTTSTLGGGTISILVVS